MSHGMIYIREGSSFDLGPIYHDNNKIYIGGTITAFSFGVSGTEISISASDPIQALYATCAATTGWINTFYTYQTMTAASTANQIEVGRFELNSNVKTGAWANALMAKIDYSTSGYAHGIAGVVCAELDLPGSTITRGEYCILEMEMNVPTSCAGLTNPVTFIQANLWGGAASEFDTYGYYLRLSGYTAAAGKFVSADLLTVRCELGATDRYLVFSEAENGLHLGTSGSPNTLAASSQFMTVYTTSSTTTGAINSATFSQTMTGAATTNQIEAVQCILTSNVCTGAWANALLAKVNYSTNGYAHGIAGVICGELDLPGSAITRGEYCILEMEMNVPTSCSGLTNPVTFIQANLWGGAASEFDTHGYLLRISGHTANSGKFVSNDLLTVRCELGTTDRYLVFSEAENGVHLGTSGSPNSLSASSPYASVYTTSSATTGSLASMTVSQVMTAEATSNQIEVGQFILTSAVKTGAWANAILAKIDYSTAGYAHGIAGVVCAELDMPAGSVTRGEYCIWEAEINCPTGCVLNSNPIHVFQINVWGGAATQFDAYGYLFDLVGVTSGATSMWYDHQGAAPANIEEWIRVKTPGGTRWLPLYNAVV